MSAGVARAGAEIHDVIGAANRFFVVLDDENRVAEIAQRFERVEQAAIVARVQTDGRLVEHVEHAAQSRADLRRQTNALRFAAGKRGGGAVEREIAEADVEEKFDALGDFRNRARGDFSLAQREMSREFCRRRRARRASGSAVKSAIEKPAIFTARLSGRRRRSLQTAHGTGDMYCVSHSR